MACIGGYCRDGQRRFHQRGSCSYSNGTVCLRRLVDRVSKTDFELTLFPLFRDLRLGPKVYTSWRQQSQSTQYIYLRDWCCLATSSVVAQSCSRILIFSLLTIALAMVGSARHCCRTESTPRSFWSELH